MIDADMLPYDDVECVDGNTYMIVHAPDIDRAKTAYDVDKVIEQIKERMCSIEDEATDIGCYMRNRYFRDAIEIVEFGSIEEGEV